MPAAPSPAAALNLASTRGKERGNSLIDRRRDESIILNYFSNSKENLSSIFLDLIYVDPIKFIYFCCIGFLIIIFITFSNLFS